MRERYRLGIKETLVFSYIIIAVTVVLVAGETSTSGIVAWAIFLGCTSPLASFVHAHDAPFANWVRLAFVAEVLNGVAWGSVTWLALPSSDVRQALLCAILVGVMVAASISSAQFRWLSLGYLLPYATLSISGFLIAEGGLKIAVVLLAVAFVFSVIMADEHRSVHLNLVGLILENDDLVTKLEGEHNALSEANAQLDAQAWVDFLTGLANRAAMMHELEARLGKVGKRSERQAVTVAFLDLNGFKQVNDTWGHQSGDYLLRAVADRLRTVTAEGELVSRLGGDEFVVISDSPPASLAETISSAFSEPLIAGDRMISILAGVGVASTTTRLSPDELLRRADRALYRHKHSLGDAGSWQVFDDAMSEELTVRKRLQADVRDAFERSDITPWFQPIADMITGDIVSAEALVRWEHDDGVRAAGSFLDILTEEGLIDALTERTFEVSWQLQADVEASGRPRPKISINVNPTQLEQVLTRRSGVGDLSAIAIEITENSAIPNHENVIELLKQAQGLGAEIHVDDFGTGYSSLARTASLPIDVLKIDRSFVATLNSSREARAVVSTIVDLADKLGLRVIAEGVETQFQVDALLDLGVPYGQGFFFSPAVSREQLTRWLIHRTTLLPDIAEAA